MKKILAIDDNNYNLILIKSILVKHFPDHLVLTATSGESGIHIVKEELPDIILLDIIMPGINGFEVCQLLKEDKLTKHIPILLVSALGQNTEDRVKGLNVGAEAFITKPFDIAELVGQVKVLLRIKSAEDSLRKQYKSLEISIKKQTQEFNNYQAKLKELNMELILTEEKERRRIAGYLHDGIGQMLSIAHINLSSLLSKNLDSEVQKMIRASTGLLNDAIVQSRMLTYDLSPPILYELGLIPAIRWKLDQIKSNYPISVMVQASETNLDIDDNTRILLYRIICELLINVVKHAEANLIEVQFTKDENFYYFAVIDNGHGFDDPSELNYIKKGGHGLFSIHERLDALQGKLRIETETQKGTKAIVSIPIKK